MNRGSKMDESLPDESTVSQRVETTENRQREGVHKVALVTVMFFGREMREKAKKENGKSQTCPQSVRSPCANGIIKGGGAAKRKIYKREPEDWNGMFHSSQTSRYYCMGRGLDFIVPMLAKFYYHNPMFKSFSFITRLALAHPKVVCAISVSEILVKSCFVFQQLHARPQFRFVTRKEDSIDNSEIEFCHFITIRTKAVFNRYVHNLFAFSFIYNHFISVFDNFFATGQLHDDSVAEVSDYCSFRVTFVRGKQGTR